MRLSGKMTAALIVGISGFLASGSAHAGPCTVDIAKFEELVWQSRGHDAGLTAPQSVDAQLSHQPTPGSLRRAERRLHSKFSAKMARAKSLDAHGNPACAVALGAAKKLFIP